MNNSKIQKIRKKWFHKSEHAINKLIIYLGMFLLTITAIVMAHDKGWISINLGVIAALKTASIILWTYFIATIFIRLTQTQVFKIFDESVEPEQKLLLSKFYISFIYLLSTAFVLWKMGVTQENIALVLGFLATGIAFAVRDVIQSFFVWYMLLTKKLFRIGDYIKIDDEEGIVRHIGTFFVFIERINTDLKGVVKIPNKIFLEKKVITYSGGVNVPVIIKAPINSVDLKDVDGKIKEIKNNLLKKYPDYKIDPKLISSKEFIYLHYDFTVPKSQNLAEIKHNCFEETYKYFKGIK